jgi:hypothetical protein
MKPASDDVRAILDGESALGLTFGTNLFVGEQPKSPDECVTVFDTGPTDEDHPDYTLEYPKVMIKVRGMKEGYLDSYALLDSIRTLMNGYSTTVGGTRYLAFWVMSYLWLGYDENRRPMWSLNLRTQRTA